MQLQDACSGVQHPDKLQWRAANRCGLSASQFGMALGFCGRVSDFVDYQRNIVGTHLEFQGNEMTAHGLRTESKARCCYECLTGNAVTGGGFFSSADRLLGCSPDGQVQRSDCDFSDQCPRRLLEIKSPFRALFDGRKRENQPFGIPHAYLCQMQGQLHLSNADECDFFVFYDGHDHVDGQVHVACWRVFKSEEFWRWCEPKLYQVIQWMEAGQPPDMTRSFEFPPFVFSTLHVEPIISPLNLTTKLPLDLYRFPFFQSGSFAPMSSVLMDVAHLWFTSKLGHRVVISLKTNGDRDVVRAEVVAVDFDRSVVEVRCRGISAVVHRTLKFSSAEDMCSVVGLFRTQEAPPGGEVEFAAPRKSSSGMQWGRVLCASCDGSVYQVADSEGREVEVFRWEIVTAAAPLQHAVQPKIVQKIQSFNLQRVASLDEVHDLLKLASVTLILTSAFHAPERHGTSKVCGGDTLMIVPTNLLWFLVDSLEGTNASTPLIVGDDEEYPVADVQERRVKVPQFNDNVACLGRKFVQGSDPSTMVLCVGQQCPSDAVVRYGRVFWLCASWEVFLRRVSFMLRVI